MNAPRITRHARLRGRERMGLAIDALQRTAAIALEQGIPHAATKGRLRRYLDKLFLHGRKANNLRVHGRKVYLFANVTLISVLDLPHEFERTVDKLNRVRSAATSTR